MDEPGAPARVLLVDADAGRVASYEAALSDPSAFATESVADPNGAKERLSEGGIDVVLVGARSVGAVPSLAAAAPDVPVLAVVTDGDDRAARDALAAGARDFVPGPEVHAEVLRRTIRYALEWTRMQGELHRHAVVDELTGMHNSRGFEQLAGHHLRLASRTKEPVVLVFVRIDELREIAETHGAAEVPRLVADAAVVLRQAVRDSDVVARIGADAFGVLLTGNALGAEALVLSRLVEALAVHNARSGRPYRLALSVGAAAFDPANPSTLDELIRRADERMQERRRPEA